MRRIDKAEIEGLLGAGQKGCIFLTVFYSTDMDKAMNKGGRARANKYYGQGIRKECAVNGGVGVDYNAAVNRLAAKEGKEPREAKPRKWGVLRDDRKFVDHTPKGTGMPTVYLQIMVRSATKPVYRYADGSVMPENEVQEMLTWRKTKKKSSTQEDLDGEVVCRDIQLENILAIRVNKEYYRVDDLKPVLTVSDVLKAKVATRFDELVEAHSAELKAELEEYIREMIENGLKNMQEKPD